MLSNPELVALLTDLESDRVERKESISDGTSIRQAICAFANDLPGHQLPGVIFIGVKDDGTCSEIEITDELLLTLANMKSDGNILPVPTMVVQKRTINQCHLVMIEVQPSLSPPVRFKGRIWIRVGPRRDTASADDERRLTEKSVSGNRPFDQQAVVGATIADLDMTLFEREYLPLAVAPDVLESNDRTTQERLRSLRFLTPDGVPTVAALLLLGEDPRNFIPGAYIQFVRFRGSELTSDILNRHEVTGPLPDQIRLIEGIVNANIDVATDLSHDKETLLPDYPGRAIQEIIRNAVIHRNYESSSAPVRVYWFSDRLEIHSPGGPYGQVTPENFGEPSITDYRNPVIAEAAGILGYVQRFGMGIALAQKLLKDNHNLPLFMETSSSAVAVTIRKRT